ncbi:DUF551 domain-containing protein [Serratia liquefaciens]|uniref:DUF551 domain-containing protein n=1 Tax=Serratia liquefaciens TaxID=614 RepID=UPI0011F3C2DD|nr:DUF551 domain-containing protein [Serratia liquefaciens]QIC87548.1 DUF551 domain-containing protein [Serratia liquefaciens]
MRFENFTIDDLFTRCVDIEDGSMFMNSDEVAALRRKIAEIRTAQPVTQGCNWIACGEQLPAVGETVLVSSDGYVSVGESERSGANYRYFTSVATGRELTVTHWMPLPAAPEGGN